MIKMCETLQTSLDVPFSYLKLDIVGDSFNPLLACPSYRDQLSSSDGPTLPPCHQ